MTNSSFRCFLVTFAVLATTSSCSEVVVSTPQEGLCGDYEPPSASLLCGEEPCIVPTAVVARDTAPVSVVDVNDDELLDIVAGDVIHFQRSDGTFRAESAEGIRGYVYVDADPSVLPGALSISLAQRIFRVNQLQGTQGLHSVFSDPVLPTGLRYFGASNVDEDGSFLFVAELLNLESGDEHYLRMLRVQPGVTAVDIEVDDALHRAVYPGPPKRNGFGMWLSDYDRDGVTDILTPDKLELLGEGARQDSRVIHREGILSELASLSEEFIDFCDGLPALALPYDYLPELQVGGENGTPVEVHVLAIANIDDDRSLDLIYTEPRGTFIGFGAWAPPTSVSEPQGDGWIIRSFGDVRIQESSALSTSVWLGAKVLDVNNDEIRDIVGVGETQVEVFIL